MAINGELVMLNEKGRPQFHPLHARLSTRNAKSIATASQTAPAKLFAFDLIALGGKDLRNAKRADSPYRTGRSPDWVKIKTPAG